ncbi:MAG: cytochrome c biogenesis protein ResB [Thiohalophilus sp.]|uniref:cytochrome c biogenesis protein ResB n=1 Tax=Thiohalophilus sp. TaxID=3028392 RepID=UPI0028707BA7|nr:cytochrome c biogenesis protein ResB [Thiohalophilus sp.]MDR9436702.1 cytochrome c biogenesis protein ResB [Thiohalophilus sp.]
MNKSRQQKPAGLWLEFLGSMNLAITMLVVIAVASVIGTVLQQNQPYQDYIIKFGPYWHEIFKVLDLYDVYGAVWFLLLLGFLLLSTSVCVYRNGPGMLRDMRHFRLNMKEKSLRVMRNFREWTLNDSPQQVEQTFTQYFNNKGYRARRKEHEGVTILALMKGQMNRLGYLFTHVGIVVICIGGLMDGNLGLSIKEWLGGIKIEKRDIAAKEVPPISRLGPGENWSFRGSITLPEDSVSNMVFLNIRDGYLVQELPFAVELKEFRVEHYASGQPKSFESDLVIHDDQLEEPMEETIAVNHPLIYRGYAIYQASFSDGGTKMQLKAWPLFDSNPQPIELDGKVAARRQIETPNGVMTIEFENFKEFNVFPADEELAVAPDKVEQSEMVRGGTMGQSSKKFTNYGPSFTFRVRQPNGEAREFVNYMVPVRQEGRYFFLSGMRESQAEPFRYLHIPADDKMSVDRFMRLHAWLNDEARVRRIAEQSARQAMSEANMQDKQMLQNIVTSMVRLTSEFNRGGYQAIDQRIQQTVPEQQQMKVAETYLKILNTVLENLYWELLQAEGVALEQGISPEQGRWFEDAVNALASMGPYSSPFYLQMTDFDLRQASGLQITRSPGKNVVYLGCVMLMIGVFLMFYITHQRLWVMIRPEGQGSRVMLAGMGNRNQTDFSKGFDSLADELDRHYASRQ